MTVKLGILALLEAKAGAGDKLAAFLKATLEIAVAEEGTVTWYAFKISDTTYGILDSFETEDARNAHLNGQIPVALGRVEQAARQRPRHQAHRHPGRQVTVARVRAMPAGKRPHPRSAWVSPRPRPGWLEQAGPQDHSRTGGATRSATSGYRCSAWGAVDGNQLCADVLQLHRLKLGAGDAELSAPAGRPPRAPPGAAFRTAGPQPAPAAPRVLRAVHGRWSLPPLAAPATWIPPARRPCCGIQSESLRNNEWPEWQ